jgi:hypothetical protein
VGLGVPLLALAGKSEKSCPPMGDPNWFDCNASNDSASMKAYTLAGAGLAAGLLIVVIGRNAVELHPIDAAEARRLAEEYNKKLKARLGVARAAPAEPEPPITQVSVSLAPLRGGGMVGLALTF